MNQFEWIYFICLFHIIFKAYLFISENHRPRISHILPLTWTYFFQTHELFVNSDIILTTKAAVAYVALSENMSTNAVIAHLHVTVHTTLCHCWPRCHTTNTITVLLSCCCVAAIDAAIVIIQNNPLFPCFIQY